MSDTEPALCPDCNGVGNVIMSTCCGRGCATCPGGEAMIQAVPCYRCKGRGVLPAQAKSLYSRPLQ